MIWMDYSKSYEGIKTLSDRIRDSAAKGKLEKAGGGLGARLKDPASVADTNFDEVRARYMGFVQNMFADMPSEKERSSDIEAYLAYGDGIPTPKRNPKIFETDLKSGDMTDREILALTLQAEAGGEGEFGMLAAGSVIANRVNSGKFGKGWRGVILAPGQFSAWNSLTGYAGGEGGLNMSSIKPTEEAYRVADALIAGAYDSPVGGATHYYNPDVATPAWGKQAGGEWTTIGNHVFGYGG